MAPLPSLSLLESSSEKLNPLLTRKFTHKLLLQVGERLEMLPRKLLLIWLWTTPEMKKLFREILRTSL